MKLNVNFTVIRALMKRDLKLYFSNPAGYVFITLFIFLSAAAAFWQDRFFLNNLANLDQLNNLFPYLLMIFVPAITMGVWSEERKQGTEELLLTLPATDLEIVLGKFLSTFGIYTAALVLSLSHLVVLFWLGRPDLGLMLGNYLGYWLAGFAFISVGMLASMLSANVTVAFILGAVMCAFFVYVEPIAGVFGAAAERAASRLAIYDHFFDFARGVVSFSGFLYFLSITGFMLYLNVMMLGRRHWGQSSLEKGAWVHRVARLAAIVVVICSINVMAGRGSARIDTTAEKLHTLSGETRDLLHSIDKERPVFVQAYISPDVPRQLVQTRTNLVGFLKEIDAVAGERVHVIINDTDPYSDEAREAREKFAIQGVDIADVSGGQSNVHKVFMGVAFTCGAEEDVIPFFDRGLPTEYELARSIRVVARTKRKRVGVLTTQIRMFGGFDFNTFASKPAWPVVDELKKQYDVVQISAKDSISEDLDALLVALPSSLSQEEMDNLRAYMAAGNPTLLLVDPLPIIDLGLSPSEESGANVNPFMRNRGPQPEPKGDIEPLLREFGIQWNKAQIVWDAYNPHPDLAGLPPEVVFVGRHNQNPMSFNDEYPASNGLQELVMLFPGTMSAAGSDLNFEPLIKCSVNSGSSNYQQLVQRSFFGVQLAQQGVPRYQTPTDYTIAAHVSGKTDADSVNVIVIGDVDFISDQFFQIRRQGIENLDFDNVSFFLNCIDVLAGDDSFLALRRRRVQHRTLTTVERRTQVYAEQRAAEQQQADSEAQKALSEAQQHLNEKVAQVQQRTDLDANTKNIMVRNLQEAENRKFETMKANIESERDAKVEASKETMEGQVRRIQSNIKTLAGLIPPIPVFGLGIVIFVRRRRREREGAAAARRLRS